MEHVVGHLEGVGEGRALVRDPEQVLVRDDDQRVDEFLQLLHAGLGEAHAVRAFEMERLGDDADGEDAGLARRPGDDRRGAGAGAAAHAGGDEHHVGAVERLHDLLDRLFGGGAADIGPRAGAEAARRADAELDAALGERLRHRLRVGVADQELAADEVGADHVVDGVAAGAADADHADARLQLVVFPGNAQIQ